MTQSHHSYSNRKRPTETNNNIDDSRLQTARERRHHGRIGLYVLRNYLQFLGLLTIVVFIVGGILLVRHGLRTHGIPFTYNFLNKQANFEISQGLTIVRTHQGIALKPFTSQDTNLQALITGAYNTLIISLISIVLTTVLGVFMGVCRLSSNWIVGRWAFLFVEFIRNTPLLVQLVFWYFAVLVELPPLSSALRLPGGIVASNRGIYFPTMHLTSGFELYMWFALAGVILVTLGWIQHKRKRLSRTFYIAAGTLFIIGWMVSGRPFSVEHPAVSRFQVSGGIGISPEMAALVIALVINTAAFIAEIVRGAVQSIDKGQWEAAYSLGLGRGEVLRIIILPQAVRVIIPSLGNQYVSMAKNTSFGIAIGFPDLFNVYGTVANQTGRYLEGILVAMAFYLVISLGISGLTNAFNRSILRKGARA